MGHTGLQADWSVLQIANVMLLASASAVVQLNQLQSDGQLAVAVSCGGAGVVRDNEMWCGARSAILETPGHTAIVANNVVHASIRVP